MNVILIGVTCIPNAKSVLGIQPADPRGPVPLTQRAKGPPFNAGDRVVVTGPPGRVVGEVLEAATPNKMPDLGPGSRSLEAMDLIREMRVDLVLLIGHVHDGKQVCFFALHNPSGWVDLRGQTLTLLKADAGGLG
jgi:hypothetical protein